MNEYLSVWDIAKRRDFTTGFTCKVTPEILDGNARASSPDRIVNFLDILKIDKFNNISYPETVNRIALRMSHRDLVSNCDLLVDGTGVGEAVVDLLRERNLAPIPILFTGGTDAKAVYADFGTVFGGSFRGLQAVKEWRVPKADLVAAGQLVAQQGRVRIAQGIRYADDFRTQMEGFRGKVNEATGRKKYENENDEIHDDMVVCYLMAAWWMVQGQGAAAVKERRITEDTTAPTWEPSDNWR